MLVNASNLLNYPILSLHMSGMIARVSEIIVNPDDLKIAAFRVDGPGVGTESGEFLQEKDVREFSELGMVIDSADDFVFEDDAIRLQKILDLNFDLIDKSVETKRGTKLGKVSEYIVNSNGFIVQQLIVRRPLFKSFIDPELIIGRSEVIKITDDKIIVRDEESKIRAKAQSDDFIPNFVNPFREPQPLTADSQTLDEPDIQ